MRAFVNVPTAVENGRFGLLYAHVYAHMAMGLKGQSVQLVAQADPRPAEMSMGYLSDQVRERLSFRILENLVP